MVKIAISLYIKKYIKMSVVEYITLLSLLLLYSGGIIGIYVKMNVKLKELEIMINRNYENYEKHLIDTEKKFEQTNKRFDIIKNDNKKEHKEILVKVETLLEKLNNFQIDMVGKFSSFSK
jgi:hypothetical protein